MKDYKYNLLFVSSIDERGSSVALTDLSDLGFTIQLQFTIWAPASELNMSDIYEWI